MDICSNAWNLFQQKNFPFSMQCLFSGSISILQTSGISFGCCDCVMCAEQEIRPWTHMMDVPQLHGLGPAANRLLDSYGQLLKVSDYC
jgi:hypothetical protein